MTDQEALLRAIEANPDEDTPRLAYADWLEEHAATDADRARAAFMRVHCEFERAERDDPRWAALARREAELRPAAFAAWQALLGKARHWVFARGLPTELTLGAAAFIREGPKLNRSLPFTHLRIERAKGHVSLLAKSPLLGHVGELRLGREVRLAANELGQLLRSRNWRNLHRLVFWGLDIGPGVAAALAKADMPNLAHFAHHYQRFNARSLGVLGANGFLARLRSLTCNYTEFMPAAARALARTPDLAMTDLDLSHNPQLTAEGVCAIAESPNFKRLRNLSLYTCCHDNADLAGISLAKAPFFAQLHSLDLGMNGVGDPALNALAKVGPSELTRLELANSSVTAAGLESLVQSRGFQGLRKLNLNTATRIGKDGFRVLAEAKGLPALEHLDVSRTALTCFSGYYKRAGPGDLESFAAFIVSPLVARLKRLDISDSNLGRMGLILIAESEAVRGLTALRLDSNLIDNAGVLALANSPNLANLRWLALGDVVDEFAAMAIASSAYLRSLTRLEIVVESPGPACLAMLRERFGPGLLLSTHA